MNNLKLLRKEMHITQAQLAEIFHTNQVMIALYETGKREPNSERLKEMASFFHTTVDYLTDVNDVTYVPILGTAAAGEGHYAEEHIEGWELCQVPPDMIGRYYFLNVKGDSMYPHIQDGDLVLCEKGDYFPTKGSVYVVMIGDTATLKMAEVQKNGMLLTAYNTDVYSPHYFTAEECVNEPVRIIGRVKEVKRRM
ncbi:MAG: XRE family transcriptional regulator [Acidaminococcaceae bacterium]|nr:XRE family transcriptional regulator [Acidaminococcaceae bacterium]